MGTPTLTFASQLQSVPVVNQRLQTCEKEDGRALEVSVELRYRGIARVLRGPLKLTGFRRYELRGVGLQVFKSIDGKKTFEQLIDEFAARHKLTFLESRALLMQYIHMLLKRGIVTVGVRRTT